jgi:arylsulfatase A
MKRSISIVFLLLISCLSWAQNKKNSRPNIVIIYLDDLGYGDISCNGAKGVRTPNVDKLAKSGILFTDAHSSAATCTPSRYSLLTGSYAFRNNAAILPGDAPLLIRPGVPTLPRMLQQAGYTTGVIGKWHLGLGDGSIDWNGEIKPGPNEIGFDYSFLIPATQDRVPCVFVENRRVVNLDPKDPITVSYNQKVGNNPTGLEHPELLKIRADTQHSNTIVNSISRIGYMTGGNSARWKDEDFPDVLLQKANTFINSNKNNPFFLFFSLSDIHVPRDPNPMFKNKSTMGRRGDDIAQMDWITGEVMKVLEQHNLTNNTLVIFTSDNGPILNDGYSDDAEAMVGDHKPAGPFKGGKYSAFEGGTRMPTIVYWPGKIKHRISNALISQVDLYASIATLVGHTLKPDEAPDSMDLLAALLGQSSKGRTTIMEEAFTYAVRDGDWKYIDPQRIATPAWQKSKRIETGLQSYPQLYNLKTDISEQNNLAESNEERVKKMQLLLQQIEQGGTRPGYRSAGSNQ